MQNESLISVIIPVYNVEKYLDRCVESVVNQTYKNLEIFLVDDGSPDNCPQMCDDWTKKDARIKVIHKENGGLSSARNVALEILSGDYLTFIDSDDYVRQDMLEIMLDRIFKDNSDMAICNYERFSDNPDDEQWDNTHPLKNEVISREEAHKRICFGEYWHYVLACCKLYKSELFEGFEFPEGRLHEDMFTSHLIIDKCNSVSCVEDALYYYYQNDESISNTFDIRSFDIMDSYLVRFDFYYGKELYSCAAENLRVMIFKMYKFKESFPEDSEVKKKLREYKTKYNECASKLSSKKIDGHMLDLIAFRYGWLPHKLVNHFINKS